MDTFLMLFWQFLVLLLQLFLSLKIVSLFPQLCSQDFSCLGKSSYVLVLVFWFFPPCSKGQLFTVQPFAMACSVTGGTLCFIMSLAPCTSHKWICILRTNDLQGLIIFPQARFKTSSLVFKSKSHKVYLNRFFQNDSSNFRSVLILQ